MAEASVDKSKLLKEAQKKKRVILPYQLSEVLQVRVTDKCQVQFVITPLQDFMECKTVELSHLAFESLLSDANVVKVAVSQKKQKAEDATGEHFLYHPKSKFMYVTRFSVALKTFSSRGADLTEHQLYMSYSEWEELLLKRSHLMKDLNLLRWETNAYSSKKIQKFVIKLIKDNKIFFKPENVYYFLGHAHVVAAAYMKANNCENAKIEVEEIKSDPEDPLDIMEKTYTYCMLLVINWLKTKSCCACANGFKVNDKAHKEEGECQEEDFDHVEKLFPLALKICSKELIGQVFRIVWFKMGMQPFHTGILFEIMKEVSSFGFQDFNAFVKAKIVEYGTAFDFPGKYKDEPELLVIGEVFRESKYDFIAMYEEALSTEEQIVTSVFGNKDKEMKILATKNKMEEGEVVLEEGEVALELEMEEKEKEEEDQKSTEESDSKSPSLLTIDSEEEEKSIDIDENESE